MRARLAVLLVLLLQGACGSRPGPGAPDGPPAAPAPVRDPGPALRRAFAELVDHCDLALTLTDGPAVDFKLYASPDGALVALERAGAPVDLARACGGWGDHRRRAFLPTSASASTLRIDPREVHATGIGALTTGLHASGLTRLGLVRQPTTGSASFTQDGERRPVSVRFDERWFWPDRDHPALVAEVNGAQGVVVRVTVRSKQGTETRIPADVSGPLLLGERPEAIDAALGKARGPDGTSALRDGNLVDEAGRARGRYELESACSLRWRVGDSGPWTVQPFVATEGVVYWSEGGRALDDGTLLLCFSGSLVISIPPGDEPTGWSRRWNEWLPIPVRCTIDARRVSCRTAVDGLPYAHELVRVGRALLPPNLHGGVAPTSSAPLGRAFPSPARASCEALVDRWWQAVRPTVELFGEAVDEAERAYRGQRDTRRFADACTRAPDAVRACLAAVRTDSLDDADACLHASPTYDEESQPGVPHLRVDEPAPSPLPLLSPAEERAARRALLGAWANDRAQRWTFERDRVTHKFGGVARYRVPRRGTLRIERATEGEWTALYELVDGALFIHEQLLHRVADRAHFMLRVGGDLLRFDEGRCQLIDRYGVAHAAVCSFTDDGARFSVRRAAGGRETRYRVLRDFFAPEHELPPLQRVAR